LHGSMTVLCRVDERFQLFVGSKRRPTHDCDGNLLQCT
jgi:hypothetical protein